MTSKPEMSGPKVRVFGDEEGPLFKYLPPELREHYRVLKRQREPQWRAEAEKRRKEAENHKPPPSWTAEDGRIAWWFDTDEQLEAWRRFRREAFPRRETEKRSRDAATM